MTRHVVVAGGGVAALETVLALRELVGDSVSIELVAPTEHFVFAPMTVAAPFGRGGAARHSLADFARDQDARFRSGAIGAVESDRRTVVTAAGERISYDVLVVAVGARAADAVEGAVSFPGVEADTKLRDLLAALVAGTALSAAFIVPAGTTWALPAYELALLAAGHLERHGADGVTIQLVTAEASALAVFGREASDRVSALLRERGIVLRPSAVATAFRPGQLELAGDDAVVVDRAVALRRLHGPALPGLPSDGEGFIPVDAHGRVDGLSGVYAAGDATTFPLKQGGLAAQQADAAAEAIAAELGLRDAAEPFRPVLRGQLLTGGRPYYLRAEVLDGGAVETRTAEAPLWWPPAKIAGRLLAPYLAALKHGGTPVSGPHLVDAQPEPTEVETRDLDDVADLADALATVDVSWVSAASLRPSPRAR